MATKFQELNRFGDIQLTVKAKGGSSCDFRVSSHQLMSSSSFFTKLLSPEYQFAEAVAFRAHRTLGPFPLSISLEDVPTDKALESCETILRGLHALPLNLPDDGDEEFGVLTLDCLYDLCVVADYLDCGEALGRTTNSRLPNLGTTEYEGKIEELDKWIFVVTILWHLRYFRLLARYCILRGQPKRGNGFLVHGPGLNENKSWKIGTTCELKFTPQRVITSIINETTENFKDFGQAAMEFDKMLKDKTSARTCVERDFSWICWISRTGTVSQLVSACDIQDFEGNIRNLHANSKMNFSALRHIVLSHQTSGLPALPKGHSRCAPLAVLLTKIDELVERSTGLDLAAL